jgi:hypothetical protein
MACKDTAGRMRARCALWEATQRARCDQWRTQWTQRCDRWRTEWSQRCAAWHTESERRCDRWEEEQTRNCSSWGPFAIFCIIWAWVSTWVCRAWSWITTTICDVWTWVSSTICDLWTWVSNTICLLWVLVTTFVCRLWVLVIDIWCSIICALRLLLAPHEFSQSRSECIYGWTAAYRIVEDLRECILRITLRIRLVADADVSASDIATVIARWEPAIEAAWSNRFVLALTDGTCRCKRYSVTVDVKFVSSGEHHVVNVHSGSGRADMGNWYVNSTGGTAAHESGHMFGNSDEYADSNCPSRTVTSDGSIMQNSQTGTVKQRHYQGFADWLSNHTCCTYRVR